MRILIDAMGGDNAPGEIVRGAVEASREFHVDVALVGREAEILACLNEMGVASGEHIQVVNAPDVISMEDDLYNTSELLFLEEIQKKFEISSEKRRELISIVYAERDLREKATRIIKN